MFRAVIMCAGEQTRWKHNGELYAGIMKQMAEVDGEPILHRTIRLLNERGIDDIYVAYKNYKPQLHAYEMKSKLFYQENTKYDIDRFCGASDLVEGDTLFLYGDVFYTEKAMTEIIKHKTQFYGRFGKGVIKNYRGEIFAVWINEGLLKKAFELRKLAEAGQIKRCIAWELYRLDQNIPLTEHRIEKNFTEINDLTEDFDTPQDYETFIGLWHTSKPTEVFHNLPQHNSVLHVGGHLGREADFYKEVTFIEPQPKYAEYLRLNGYDVIEGAIGGDKLYITSYDQASSVLKPLKHKISKRIKVKPLKLKDITGNYDMLVLDVQGSEYNVLKSGDLQRFKHIICEASNTARYEGAKNKTEIVDYLKSKGFEVIKEFKHSKHDIYDIVFRRT